MAVVRALSVKQLNMYVKSVLESDANLHDIIVHGEISNYTRNIRSGHAYFTLRDAECSVRVVMFRSYADQVRFEPGDGLSVFITGHVTLYERDGQYQLYAVQMTPEGIGAEYLRFLQLKDRLEKEGLFDPEYKRPLPKYPQRIGIATSKTGAAVHDVCSIIRRRYPIAQLYVYPCSVQGGDCAPSVIRALRFFNRENNVDLIIIARGGGAYEDLAGFNDETLAREAFGSHIPIVSAVGHEVDITIIDLVADVRAATPSAAAELSVPEKAEEVSRIMHLRKLCVSAIKQTIDAERRRLSVIPEKTDPRQKLILNMQRLDIASAGALERTKSLLDKEKIRLTALTEHLSSLNPLAVLSRGYALARKDSKIIKSIKDIVPGEKFVLQLKDGGVNCVAEKDADIRTGD